MLRALKGTLKHNVNISTNGVDLNTLHITRLITSSWMLGETPQQHEEKQDIDFNVWDFGGKSVFHATHRLFLTFNTLYIVLYDMSKLDTIERLKLYSFLVSKHNLANLH